MTAMSAALTEHQRAMVLLPGGGLLDLLDPSPLSWTDGDLATGLARTYRWGGHSRWPRPLSVAQHSLTVLAIREILSGPLTPDEALYELLHDAEEGLLGFDCIAPLKPFLGAPFAALCETLTAAIAVRYELPGLAPEAWRRHKQADRIAAASEALHIVQWTRNDIRTTLQITETPLDTDPLEASEFASWEPWPSDFAAMRWLKMIDFHRDRRQQARSSLRNLS